MTSWGDVRDDLRECRGSEETARSGSDATAGRARRARRLEAPRRRSSHEPEVPGVVLRQRGGSHARRARLLVLLGVRLVPLARLPERLLDRRGAGRRARAQELLGLLDESNEGRADARAGSSGRLLDGSAVATVPEPGTQSNTMSLVSRGRSSRQRAPAPGTAIDAKSVLSGSDDRNEATSSSRRRGSRARRGRTRRAPRARGAHIFVNRATGRGSGV